MKTKIYLVALLICLAGRINPTYAQFSVLLNFTNTTGAYLGATPQADQNLISIGDGFLYGMTSGGGAGIGGTVGVIFKVKPDGTEYKVLKQFDGGKDGADNNIPNGRGPNGTLYYDGTFLYATTVMGGTNGTGTIVKIKPDGTGFAKIYEFAQYKGGTKCTLVSDGTFLYGNNFKIKPDGTGYADFAYPCSGSWLYDGTFLYGLGYENTTNGQYGTVFKVKPDGTGYVLLSYFTKNSGYPRNNTLITDGTYLYGVCEGDGSNSYGSAFKVKTDGTGFVKLPIHDRFPKGRFVLIGTDLYGMTREGGANNMGTIYKISADGVYTLLHSLNGGASYPSGSLLSVGNTLYGMTASGGTTNENRYGSIFKYQLIPTGINDTHEANDFSIYPNPASSQLTIKVKEKSQISIVNILGNVIKSETVNGASSLDVSNWTAGVYIVKISDGKTSRQSSVIIHR
jgi:uncharacterized repeat protein (TIGR03803 family)